MGDHCARDELEARREELDVWLTDKFSVHADELRVTPSQYVAFLRLLATGNSLHLENGIDSHMIISMALHGALRKDN